MKSKIVIATILFAYSQSMSAANPTGVYAINLSSTNKIITFSTKSKYFSCEKKIPAKMRSPVRLSSEPIIVSELRDETGPGAILNKIPDALKSNSYSSGLIEIQSSDTVAKLPFEKAVITYPSLKGTIAMAQDYTSTGLYVYIINNTGQDLSVKDKPGSKPTKIPNQQAVKTLMRAPTKITPGGSATLSIIGDTETIKRAENIYGYLVSAEFGPLNIRELNKLETYENDKVKEAQAKEKK